MASMITRRAFGTLLVAAAGLAPPMWAQAAAQSQTLARPTEKPILKVTGKISVANDDGAAVFDRPMLETLGMTSFATDTPWSKGKTTFEGVPMVRLMDAVGATGSIVTAIALNDYSTDIPISDFSAHGVLLALKRNGQYMPVRDKGPLFIIYPFDSDPDLQRQVFYSRSAWQVAQLAIR
jgi:hypothetical protein